MPRRPSINTIPQHEMIGTITTNPTDQIEETISNGYWTFLASFLSTTSKLGFDTITDDEQHKMIYITEYIFASKARHSNIGNKSRSNKSQKKGYEILQHLKCRGLNFNQSKSPCSVTYIFIRMNGILALYYKAGTEHCSGCVPTRSKAPIGLIIRAHLSTISSPGKSIVDNLNAQEIGHIDKIYPDLRVLTDSGSKKLHRLLNDFVLNTKAKIKKKRKTSDLTRDSVKDLINWVEDNSMSVQTYCSNNPDEIEDSVILQRKFAILKHNVETGNGNAFDYIIFTTVGKLNLFLDVIAMASNTGESITVEIDCSGEIGLCLISLGCTDYRLSYRPLLYGLLRVENSAGALAILGTAKDIFNSLNSSSTIEFTFKVLKDGGTSFVGPAIELLYKQLACVAHMGRPKGIGTKPKNERGSLLRYLEAKKVTKKYISRTSIIFWGMNELRTFIEYFISRKLLIYELLTKFKFDKHSEETILPTNSTMEHCLKRVELYKPFMKFVEETNVANKELNDELKSNEIGEPVISTTQDADPTVTSIIVNYLILQDGSFKRRLCDLRKCDQIMVQLLSYYFPEDPTYGPAFGSGQNRNTNGLESNWKKDQSHMRTEKHTFQRSDIAILESLAISQTKIEDKFCSEPIELEEDWTNIFRYATSKKELPGNYTMAIFYESKTNKLLCSSEDVSMNIANLVVYMPTKYNCEQVLSDVIEHEETSNNPCEYSEAPGSASRQSSRKIVQFKEYISRMMPIFHRQLFSKL